MAGFMTAEQADNLIALGVYLTDAATVGLATALVVCGWHLCSFFLRERSSLIGRDLD